MDKFSQFLIEISLADHFDRYIKGKMDLSFDDYQKISSLDPTTQNDQRGKYVEWILKTYNKDVTPNWKSDGVDYTLDRHMFFAHNRLKDALHKYVTQNPKPDINTFKSFNDLFGYTDTLTGESNRQLKKKERDIFSMPDDIKVIDKTDEWICIETLTREGNIKGAQYKTNPQANWCTAYVDRDNYWEHYHRDGDLLQFINIDDPYEKYQIFIENGSIKESRDYKDSTSNKPYQIIKELPNFEKNYGKITEREPFKYIWDEEGAAGYLLDENFDQEWDYLNRTPDEDEYDDYYEEASQNEEFQINHWDRFLKALREVFDNNVDIKYGGDYVKERMESVPTYFTSPITGNDDDIEPAKEAVYDMYEELDEKWRDYLEDESDKPEPTLDSEEDEKQVQEWISGLLESFKSEYSEDIRFAEYFIGYFPHEFEFDRIEYTGGRDNSDEQMSFNFESILKKLKG